MRSSFWTMYYINRMGLCNVYLRLSRLTLGARFFRCSRRR